MRIRQQAPNQLKVLKDVGLCIMNASKIDKRTEQLQSASGQEDRREITCQNNKGQVFDVVIGDEQSSLILLLPPSNTPCSS